MTRDGNGRKSVGGRSIRWNDERAAEAYAEGHWVHGTLADALRDAARDTPARVARGRWRRPSWTAVDYMPGHDALATSLGERMPVGSVVSFMLPNWHEAAVVYLGATLAGMVVNPILPSLRDHELRFILDDVESRMIFVPAEFRGHDYAAMLSRVAEALDSPPEVVVVRGAPGPHTALRRPVRRGRGSASPSLDPDSVRMILYTSGTTGRPKGVLHTHNSIHALDPADRRALAGRAGRHLPGALAHRPHRRLDLRLRDPPAARHDGDIDGDLESPTMRSP